MIETLDIALRGGAVLLMVFVATLLWRDHRRAIAARLGAGFALGAAAYVVSSAPGFAAESAAWRAPFVALATGNAVVFWLFARALFDDGFAWRTWHAAAWTTFAGVGIANCWGLAPSNASAARAVGAGVTLGTLAFAVLAVAQSLSTWRTDLVEGRRKLRGLIVGAAAAYTIINTVTRLAFPHESTEALASMLNAGALVAVIALIAWHLVGVDGQALFSSSPTAEPTPNAGDAARQAEPLDKSVVQAIERCMVAERAYREPNLTIGALAAKLGLAEYKLRRAINQGLGYRNFNVFLNRYRIRDAKAALADSTKSHMSVLEIALDAGFQSLGPFNRAFKTETGLTPSEFRRLNAGKAAAGPVLEY
ncbi:MAG: helix-turn-helix domain-containing protein [Sulfurifustaceae bacterium]